MKTGYWFAMAIGLLFSASVFAYESCPPVSSISRVPGEYSWVSTDGRWEGYFFSPRTGRGDSNQIIGFQQARWIQLTDLLKSKGVVECDYVGNSGGEIIRFITNVAAATDKPTHQYWACEYHPQFPGTQCTCGAAPKDCRL